MFKGYGRNNVTPPAHTTPQPNKALYNTTHTGDGKERTRRYCCGTPQLGSYFALGGSPPPQPARPHACILHGVDCFHIISVLLLLFHSGTPSSDRALPAFFPQGILHTACHLSTTPFCFTSGVLIFFPACHLSRTILIPPSAAFASHL